MADNCQGPRAASLIKRQVAGARSIPSSRRFFFFPKFELAGDKDFAKTRRPGARLDVLDQPGHVLAIGSRGDEPPNIKGDHQQAVPGIYHLVMTAAGPGKARPPGCRS